MKKIVYIYPLQSEAEVVAVPPRAGNVEFLSVKTVGERLTGFIDIHKRQDNNKRSVEASRELFAMVMIVCMISITDHTRT